MGRFYDAVGALRDVVQNHLLQVLALIAMEPPSRAGSDAVDDRKHDVFSAMPDLDPARMVRGQYAGYRDVDGVAADSDTETFVALRAEIDNWRWAGVPFYIRAGKALPVRATEVRVVFKHPPRLGFFGGGHRPEPNHYILRIDPNPGTSIQLQSLRTGKPGVETVNLDVELGDPRRRYAHALRGAALRGPAWRPHPLHPPGLGRGDVADRAAGARQPAARDPLRARHLGPGRGRQADRRPRRLARALDCSRPLTRSYSASIRRPISRVMSTSACASSTVVRKLTMHGRRHHCPSTIAAVT